MEQAGIKEELVRNLVAECVGRLFSMDFERFETFIFDGLDGEPMVKATFARSLTFSGRNKEIDFGLILTAILDELEKCKDDLIFRTCAYEGLNVVLQNAPKAFGWEDIQNLLVSTVADCKQNKDWIEEIDLGAFK